MKGLMLALAAAAMFLFAFGCTQPAAPSFEPGTAFLVEEGSFYYNSAEDLNILVVSFADSRCPPDVQCVWAGEQGINLRVSSVGQASDIYLGETTAPNAAFSISGRSYEFSLVSISADRKEAQIIVAKKSGS